MVFKEVNSSNKMVVNGYFVFFPYITKKANKLNAHRLFFIIIDFLF